MGSDADDTPLRAIVDYLLNQATEQELEVVQAALERRRSSDQAPSIGGMAHGMARKIQDQLTSSVDVSQMARRLAEQMIRQREPDMSPSDLKTLLDAWVPSSEQPAAGQGAARGSTQQHVPPDAVLAMAAQFLAYSVGAMPPSQQASQPQGWVERYWGVFSEETRGLINQVLRGQLEIEEFWTALRRSLGLAV